MIISQNPYNEIYIDIQLRTRLGHRQDVRVRVTEEKQINVQATGSFVPEDVDFLIAALNIAKQLATGKVAIEFVI